MAPEPAWRKSRRSVDNQSCVELRKHDQLRDSKNPTGPALRGNIPALLRAIQSGQFDR